MAIFIRCFVSIQYCIEFLCFLNMCMESALLFGHVIEQMVHTTPGFSVCLVSTWRTRLCLRAVSCPQARQRQRWEPWGSTSCDIRADIDRASERFYQCNVHKTNVLIIWHCGILNCGNQSCSWSYKTWSKVHRRTQHLEDVWTGCDEQHGACGMKSIHTPSKTICQTQFLGKSSHSHQQLKAFTFYSQGSDFIIGVVVKHEMLEHFCLGKTLSSNRNRIPRT